MQRNGQLFATTIAASKVFRQQALHQHALARQLVQLYHALRALIARHQDASARAAAGAGSTRGFASQRAAASSSRAAAAAAAAPALCALTGVSRELLELLDLRKGLRYSAQLQAAKVFCVVLEQHLDHATLAALGVGAPAPPRPQARLTKRERRALTELGSMLELGAVDPSPQRTTVASVVIFALLADDEGRLDGRAQ